MTKGITIVNQVLRYAQRLPFMGSGPGRRRILPLATAGIVVCVALVIAVVALPHVDPLDAQSDSIALVPRLDTGLVNLLLGLVVLATLGVGTLATAYLIVALRGRRTQVAGNSPPWRAIIVTVLAMLLFYFAMAFVLSLLVLPDDEVGGPPFTQAAEGEAEEQEAPAAPEPEDELTAATRARRSRLLLVVALVIGFAAAGYFAVRLMRATPEAEPIQEGLPEELRRDLAAATELAIEQLAREPDYRRAVIGCWAYLETALARHNHARPRHHTPLEYVRALVVDVPALPARALVRLAGRYEVARFSVHLVTREDRDTALSCLHDIRHKLQSLA